MGFRLADFSAVHHLPTACHQQIAENLAMALPPIELSPVAPWPVALSPAALSLVSRAERRACPASTAHLRYVKKISVGAMAWRVWSSPSAAMAGRSR